MDLVLEKKLLSVASETFEEKIYIKNGFLYSMLFFSWTTNLPLETLCQG